jgi:long-chain fatty acid transport protein
MRALARAKVVCAAAVSAVLASSGVACANPADTFGIGSRSLGLAGAVAADVPDFSANYYNPSALVLTERTQLSFGVQSVAPDLAIDGQASPVRSFRSFVFGLVAPGEVFGVPVAFGVGGQMSGDLLARIHTVASDEQRWVLLQDRPEQIFLAANVALRPARFVALSMGLGFLASTRAKLQLEGTAAQPGFAMQSEFDSRLDHEVVAELQSRRYPLFGLTLLPDDELRLGLVYRGQSQIELNVDSGFDGQLGLGPVQFPVHYLLESTTVVSFQPRQVVLGASYQGLSDTHVELDLQWIQWSAYTSPLAATKSELDLDTSGLVTPPELPEPRGLESARLGDRIVPRLGVEHVLFARQRWHVPVRAGYAFLATPLEASSTRNLVDADRHVFCFGAGVAGLGPAPLTSELSFDFHAAWSKLVPRVGTGPDGQSHRATGSVLVLGATLGLSL